MFKEVLIRIIGKNQNKIKIHFWLLFALWSHINMCKKYKYTWNGISNVGKTKNEHVLITLALSRNSNLIRFSCKIFHRILWIWLS